MEAQELRIGNLVELHAGDVVVDKSHIVVAEDFNNIDALCLVGMKPIPLTEEWLVKLGFIKCNNGFELKILEGYVFIKYIFKSMPLVLEIDDNRMPIHDVKYLHQLQNLYFALTGEELEIVEKEGVKLD